MQLFHGGDAVSQRGMCIERARLSRSWFFCDACINQLGRSWRRKEAAEALSDVRDAIATNNGSNFTFPIHGPEQGRAVNLFHCTNGRLLTGDQTGELVRAVFLLSRHEVSHAVEKDEVPLDDNTNQGEQKPKNVNMANFLQIGHILKAANQNCARSVHPMA